MNNDYCIKTVSVGSLFLTNLTFQVQNIRNEQTNSMKGVKY